MLSGGQQKEVEGKAEDKQTKPYCVPQIVPVRQRYSARKTAPIGPQITVTFQLLGGAVHRGNRERIGNLSQIP